MAKAAGRILKGNNVKLGDRFQLDAAEAVPSPAKDKDVASAKPQVSIVENQPEFVVMEVTCSCGTKTYVRCEYAAAEYPAEGSQMSVDTQQHTEPDNAQNGVSGDSEQESDQKIIGENENEN